MDSTKKQSQNLTVLEVKALTEKGRYWAGGVKGLYLRIYPNGSKLWELRKQLDNKQQDFGLGGYPAVSLAQAREKATKLLEDLKLGINPKEEKKTRQRKQAAKIKRTFATELALYIDNKKAEWRNEKTLYRWVRYMELYARPTIGDLSLGDITTQHIVNILQPIWTSKTETAVRVQRGIAAVLDWAQAHTRYRETTNPATWQGHLENILPNPNKVRNKSHHASLDCSFLFEFMQALIASSHIYRDALAFTILTAVRSGDTRGMVWGELDHAQKIWTIPPERLKVKENGKHRVPLSAQAYAILKRRHDDYLASYGVEPSPDGLVFTSTSGKKIDDNALNLIIKKMGYGERAKLHGFRSTFKDWASEKTPYPNELSELALAHAIDSKTEAAYRRGDMLEKRRQMMQDYADFADKPPHAQSNIIDLNEARKAKHG